MKGVILWTVNVLILLQICNKAKYYRIAAQPQNEETPKGLHTKEISVVCKGVKSLYHLKIVSDQLKSTQYVLTTLKQTQLDIGSTVVKVCRQ